NPCSRTAPCKTFAGAISKTAPNGEINVLDPGGFGGVTITKGITISSEGFEAGVLVSGTNAIIVNAAPTDVVILRGLDIEGLGTGLAGIKVLAAGAVHVENCTIHNFVQKGIDFQPTSVSAGSTSLLFVINTIIRDNKGGSSGGIFVKTGNANVATKALVDGVQLLNNNFGISVDGTNGSTILRISNTTIIANASSLLTAAGGTLTSFGNNRILDQCAGVAPPAPIGQQ
ncbi:MAG: right-handed parallel beta-helix repeat-containing protein, partial [Bradyrhizobium sp.]|nr:right-handed parallel beta-helix repeat-containing protein [Bradyrhizobium sp.]